MSSNVIYLPSITHCKQYECNVHTGHILNRLIQHSMEEYMQELRVLKQHVIFLKNRVFSSFSKWLLKGLYQHKVNRFEHELWVVVPRPRLYNLSWRTAQIPQSHLSFTALNRTVSADIHWGIFRFEGLSTQLHEKIVSQRTHIDVCPHKYVHNNSCNSWPETTIIDDSFDLLGNMLIGFLATSQMRGLIALQLKKTHTNR